MPPTLSAGSNMAHLLIDPASESRLVLNILLKEHKVQSYGPMKVSSAIIVSNQAPWLGITWLTT